MKLKHYIKELEKLANKYPEAILVCSSDNEGNSFNKVYYTPTVGLFNQEDQSFYPEGNHDDINEDKDHVRSICIN